MADDLTLVLDIGKSHAKLLMLDAAGAVVEEHGRANRSVVAPQGYLALDVAGLTQWLTATLAASTATRRCTRAIASTHGAAFVALDDAGLAWEPIDYEFDGYAALDGSYRSERDDFAATLAPDLPAGLNAARQLHWLQQRHPGAWARTRCLLPYPQYWAWWLSGVAATEVSSLGCHTQLWRPRERAFSRFAQAHGWAALFDPQRPAWEVLGPVRPARVRDTGLPAHCAVHVGVHDSNACLARYLIGRERMTLVSSGTWIVVMAPDAPVTALDPRRDMLANVSVHGDAIATARFMGGREFALLCGGAAPEHASLEALAELLRDEVQALPAFVQAGGPFPAGTGVVLRRGAPIDPATLGAAQRATLAALYCAQMTASLIERLGAAAPVVIEGPFAANLVYRQALAAWLPSDQLRIGDDPVEGTARGAWLLTHPGGVDGAPMRPLDPVRVDAVLVQELLRHRQRWLDLIGLRGPADDAGSG